MAVLNIYTTMKVVVNVRRNKKKQTRNNVKIFNAPLSAHEDNNLNEIK